MTTQTGSNTEKSTKPSGKKGRNSRIGKVIIFAAMAIILAVAVILGIRYVRERSTKQYDNYQVIDTLRLKSDTTTKYVPYKRGYLWYNRDGAEAVDSRGALLWNVTYRMDHPIVAVCEDCVAVGDKGARTVYMMDGTGSVNTVNVSYPIQEVEVGNQGVTAVRTSDESNDYIQIFSLNGDLLVEMKTIVKKDGFPIDIALSNDGTKLATSYLVIDGDRATSWVTFYNFSPVGKNYVKNLVGTFKYETLVPQIAFMNNDTVCAFRENGFILYEMQELPEVTKEVTFTEQVLMADSDSKHLAVVLENSMNGTRLKAIVYDLKGQSIYEETFSEEFSRFFVDGDEIMLYNDKALSIRRLSGSVKANLICAQPVYDIMPTAKNDSYLLFGDTTVQTIQLTGSTEEKK